MKPNLLALIAVALLSSIATLGLQELFRAPASDAASDPAGAEVEIPADRLFSQALPSGQGVDFSRRLRDLEQRLDRYEQASIQRATLEPSAAVSSEEAESRQAADRVRCPLSSPHLSWQRFDEWADQRYVEMLGQDLVDQVFADD